MAQANKQPTTDKQKIDKAKKQFFAGLFDMSWRLAGVFLIPVALGVWLDGRGDGSGNTFTVAGIVFGVAGSIFVIRKIVTEYTAQGGNE
jgi:hypothetical protein